jgi:hypothetical protein
VPNSCQCAYRHGDFLCRQMEISKFHQSMSRPF